MKALVLYYSYEGNTKLIAHKISEAISADLMELKPVKELKSKGFMKYVWGGKAAVMKQRPALEAFPYNVNEYDLIIFGTPVWAGTFAPAINSFLHEYKITDKKIGLFYCHGGGGPGKTINHFTKHLINNNIIGELGLLDPLKTNTEDKVNKAINWAKTLV